MTETHRRRLIAAVLAAVPLYGLLAELAPLRAARREASADRWIRRQDEIARALARGELAPRAWQAEVEALALEVDLDQLLAAIEGADGRLLGRALPSYPVKRAIRFLDQSGARRELRYAAALFTFGRNDVITPHAHRHMVSAHLVVDGALRVRTFDRLREEAGAIVIRPSGDRVIGRGAVSTMSAERDNVHWFVPRSAPAATFDVIVSGLDRGAPSYRIEALDPLRATALPDGALRAPLIGFEAASRRYTADL